MVMQRRQMRGTLTADDVQVIRQRFAAGDTQRELCGVYGVSVNTIGRIVRGETWQWLLQPETVAEKAELTVAEKASLARLLRMTGKGKEADELETTMKAEAASASEKMEKDIAATPRGKLDGFMTQDDTGGSNE